MLTGFPLRKSALERRRLLDEIFGVYDNDPIYAEVMRLGREYRESLRPKVARKPARKAGKKSAKKRGR